MSLIDQVAYLTGDRNDIRDALVSSGLAEAANHGFSQFAEDIRLLEFTAYIQITTDPSASITAVNLAGDTYSGVADDTGSLTLTVRDPGTYTLTETYDGATATGTVVVPDIDQYYATTILTWKGQLYTPGDEYESTTGGWSIGSTYAASLTKTSEYMEFYLGNAYDYGIIYINKFVDATEYSKVEVTSDRALRSIRIWYSDEDYTEVMLTGSWPSTKTVELPSEHGAVKIGITMRGGSTSRITKVLLS